MCDCNSIGVVPSSLCALKLLNTLYLQSNYGLTCSPSCLSTIYTPYSGSNSLSARCPNAQESALCGIISSTTVGSRYSEWSCNSAGVPNTDPCGGSGSVGVWRMLSCENGLVVGISNFSGFSGSFPSSVNQLGSLRVLDIHDNEFVSGEIILVLIKL